MICRTIFLFLCISSGSCNFSFLRKRTGKNLFFLLYFSLPSPTPPPQRTPEIRLINLIRTMTQVWHVCVLVPSLGRVNALPVSVHIHSLIYSLSLSPSAPSFPLKGLAVVHACSSIRSFRSKPPGRSCLYSYSWQIILPVAEWIKPIGRKEGIKWEARFGLESRLHSAIQLSP